MRVVDELQVVHVGEQEQERTSRAAPPCERFVEHTGVENAGEKVALCELAQLLEVVTMLVGEPADEQSAAGVVHEADRGRVREDVRGRNARRDEDRECVQPSRQAAADQAEPGASREREERDRDVEEVRKAETRDFEEPKGREDGRVETERSRKQQAPMERCRRHQAQLRRARPGARPSKE